MKRVDRTAPITATEGKTQSYAPSIGPFPTSSAIPHVNPNSRKSNSAARLEGKLNYSSAILNEGADLSVRQGLRRW